MSKTDWINSGLFAVALAAAVLAEGAHPSG